MRYAILVSLLAFNLISCDKDSSSTSGTIGTLLETQVKATLPVFAASRTGSPYGINLGFPTQS